MGWNSSSDDDDDVGGYNEDTAQNVSTFLLIVIDTDEGMFELDANFGKSTFLAVLQSCYEIMDRLLIKGSRGKTNHIAIMITSEDKEKATICDFTEIFPTTLKKLRALCEKTDDELKAMYQRTGALNFADVLLQSKIKLGLCAREATKYIAYITKNDNPAFDDEDLKFRAVNQAKTLIDFKIYIELLTFNKDFDCHAFFEEILFSANNSRFNYDYLLDTAGLKEKLLALVRYRGAKTRFYPVNGNPDKSFVVIEKCYIKEQKILNNVTVTKDTNQEVKKIRKGATNLGGYSVKYSKHENPLMFTEEEAMNVMNNGIPVGYELIATSEKLLEPGMHNTDPKFIQDNRRQNSPHFDLFWQYCVDKNRVLICGRKYKKGGPIKIVELSPKVINNVKSFLVLGIPFNEDITFLNEKEDDTVVTQEQHEAAEAFIHAANFEYQPTMFPDTVFCKKKEYLRSQLLDEQPREVTNVVNMTVTGDMEDTIRNFMETFSLNSNVKKRKASGDHTKKSKK